MVAVSQLSERQKTCLRLVARGMSSKEIAKETGLSPRSVDTYITDAIALLGATNRRDAARALLEQEASQQLRSQPEPIVHGATVADERLRAGLGGLRRLLVPIPVGGRLHDLNAAQKLLLALRVGITGVVILLAIITVFIGLLTVF